jgi:hypothetical protein
MDLQRVRAEIAQAANHFSYVESHSDGAQGLLVRAAFQTSAGNMYVAELQLDDYPNRMPHVFILRPELRPSPHKYTSGNICYLHPNMWNPGRHTLTFVLSRVAKWLNKYDVYRATKTWPGAELAH